VVSMDQLLKIWQQFLEIQDGGSPDFYGTKVVGFFGPQTLLYEFEGTKPSEGTFIHRKTTFEPLSVQLEPILRPVGRPRIRKKMKKGVSSKSQNRYVSPPRGGAISQPICTKFGELADLTNVITPVKCGSKIFIGFSG